MKIDLQLEKHEELLKRSSKMSDLELCTELYSQYPNLCIFIGGLLSIYPSTARVESDFSMLKLIKTERRQSLSDICLIGTIYSKQWNEMNECCSMVASNYPGMELIMEEVEQVIESSPVVQTSLNMSALIESLFDASDSEDEL